MDNRLGLLLTALPAYGYLAAYSYEKGYLRSYGIPEFLITLNIENILLATVTLLSIFFLALGGIEFFHLALQDLRSKGSILFKIPSLLLVPLIILALLYIIFPEYFRSRNDAMLVSLIVFILTFFALVSLRNNYPKISSKIHAQKEINKSVVDVLMAKKFMPPILIMAIAAIVIAMISETLGVSTAKRQETYIAFSQGDKEYALLRTNAGQALAVEINKKQNKLTNSYMLFPIDKPVLTRHKKLHPITVPERKTSP